MVKPQNIRILGIDPGSRVTGYGIIEGSANQWKVILSGCFILKGATYLERLQHLQHLLLALLSEYKPQECALEEVFLHKNANSALKLGQARGVVLANLLSFSISIFE
ncbi:MAG TPA: crossover junction endodeoxyribonuclease RuvC, partial [Gammaproteobacteria bacterium]|nr:crossover junction endodeoxyribonuclease RuvC [Gammaproteobacteria bacterium]